jgi:hypothetical protein
MKLNDFSKRLNQITGMRVKILPKSGNFSVFIITSDEKEIEIGEVDKDFTRFVVNLTNFPFNDWVFKNGI